MRGQVFSSTVIMSRSLSAASGEFDRAIEEYKYELPFFPLL